MTERLVLRIPARASPSRAMTCQSIFAIQKIFFPPGLENRPSLKFIAHRPNSIAHRGICFAHRENISPIVKIAHPSKKYIAHPQILFAHLEKVSPMPKFRRPAEFLLSFSDQCPDIARADGRLRRDLTVFVD
jgi:hypothetical protein